ncbi:GGDEF domain-containing protein [Bordetella sp. FB-8]|uniref:GGDEF domain-containing protein n=1 Tax=Bordetella sp. FB-8 TaxID=1159870 RepID=UPI000370EF2B|nr:GGDEF domain-containing protein [Bordetella sp. FB-8]
MTAVLNPVSILVVAMVLVTVMSMVISGSLRHSTVRGVPRWIGANAMAIAALLLFALEHGLPPVLSVIVANLLLALASVLGYEGCRQFFHLRTVTVLPYAGCAALVLGLAYWTYTFPDRNACIVIVSIFYASIHASIGWIAWKHRAPTRSLYGCCFIVAIAGISVLGHVIRGLFYGIALLRQGSLMQSAAPNMAFPIVGMLALPGLSMGMVMLVHERLTEQFERWANVDELTGAVTRRRFFAKAQEMIEHAAASGAMLSVAVVDLDHFKLINDQYGHAAGDCVLAHFGRLSRANLRETDVFGRVGGEEFAILFAQANRQDACSRMEGLRERARLDRRKTSVDAQDAPPQHYSFSAGVDQYRHGDTLLELLARADAALYAAKMQGRDRVVDMQEVPRPASIVSIAANYGLDVDSASSGN